MKGTDEILAERYNKEIQFCDKVYAFGNDL